MLMASIDFWTGIPISSRGFHGPLRNFITQLPKTLPKRNATQRSEEALQSAQLLGHGLLDEILDSGALCLEPGELMPIVLTLGGAEEL